MIASDKHGKLIIKIIMKQILTSIFMCLVVISAMAQNKADIEVSYSEISFYENGVERGNKYHLLANAGQSKFFNPRSEEIDSLTSTPRRTCQLQKDAGGSVAGHDSARRYRRK